jgi:3-hydroxyacyl-[acyl-carrier-protein] dehydratase
LTTTINCKLQKHDSHHDESMLDFEEIKKILPHRYPFLLVDRVLTVETGRYCKALKNVSGNEFFFNGHFPEHALMPGVLIVEALAQTGGIAIGAGASVGSEDSIMVFGGIDHARFKRQVVPGDQLILEATLIKNRGNLWIFEGVATVDEKVAVKAEVKLALVPKS